MPTADQDSSRSGWEPGRTVRIEVAAGVATLTLDRPERRNALNNATVEQLVTALDRAARDPQVRVVVLTGAGDRAFCSGFDLKEFEDLAAAGEPLPVPMTGLHRNPFEAVMEVSKPVIAALNGPAVAGGCELALSADLRIAAEGAFLQLPEVQRGMGANFATVMLQRLIPPTVANDLLFTGRRMETDEALRWGLYNSVVPAAELSAAAAAMAAGIAGNAPVSLTRIKQLSTRSSGLPLAAALRLDTGPSPYLSQDRQEGARAFLERRPPRWTGR